LKPAMCQSTASAMNGAKTWAMRRRCGARVEPGTVDQTLIFSGSVRRADPLGNFGAVFALDNGNVVLALQCEPELRAISEIAAKAYGRIGRNRPALIQNVGDTA
jgi:hypothetical protein